MVLGGKSSQEYPFNTRVTQWSILGPICYYYTLMTFLMMLSVTLLSTLMLRYLICGSN